MGRRSQKLEQGIAAVQREVNRERKKLWNHPAARNIPAFSLHALTFVTVAARVTKNRDKKKSRAKSVKPKRT
jgi:hypothetical protein